MAGKVIPPTDFRVTERFRIARILARRQTPRDPVGLKRAIVPGTEVEEYGVPTPYYAKLIRRRRATRKVAHESRRKNRG